MINKKIVILCDKRIYLRLCDYTDSFLKYFSDHDILLYQDNVTPCIDYILKHKDGPLYLFLQKIPVAIIEKCKEYHWRFIQINTEQLLIAAKQVVLNKNKIKTIDYTNVNGAIIDFDLSYIPYQVNYDEILNYEKIHDVAIVHPFSSPKRNRMVELLKQKNINVNCISGFKQERDENLFRHKILVNVHYNDIFDIFEEIRCNRCVFNKMIVISEKSRTFDLNMLSKYVIECNYNKIPECVMLTLQHYDEIYEKLFKDFDINAIEKICYEYLEKFFKSL